ncbi:acetyl-CoA C-acetyltransferase [Brevibacterium linens]|uniref:Probable acetyl-CoA acetyltransferase n=2 Tax=Brevibacterium linens TaxID=1703 RepID=A0A2H1HUW2_BRELN|nr:acetyl-CoA C-acetyltransferase [Brevibacterium linens]AZU00598.1 acetyl-CoA C-acetyltransferase [Brevibacterium linens]KAB1949181.1 acetyl-CoA C-acetyltransferase [Brevibacterium linens ATCC 9172]SMX66697.1 acetyl-CoA C-acetyltransferase [Brevibacterium linens]SMX71495.1 acetyl-CoA C-acetyltransferase [Brevibacterium linens ATCC 9172]
MADAVIVAGARTPFGRLQGELSKLSAVELGAEAIAGALDRAGIQGSDVGYVIMGQVLQAGDSQGPGRQAAVKAGIPMSVPAVSVNKLCLSGINTITQAAQLIRAGEYDVVVAGGQESMSQAPHMLMKSRSGYKYGDVVVKDHMDYDGLWDAFTDQAMGGLTEEANAGDREFSRAEQDAFSARSHQRAAAAQETGAFADEIVPVTISSRKGDVTVSADEGVRPDTTVDSLSTLRPSFRKDGTITAGNASQISDGACAVVVMSREKAEELGAPILAEIRSHAWTAGPDSTLQHQPSQAIKAAAEREGVAADSFDLYEINEAFAAVGLASAKDLGIDEDKVNVNGGAVALGHPIGASGARVVLTLALELQRRGGGTGIAALCGGGGQGDSLIVTVPARS